MNIMVFDTETTGLNKPFCYDIGYAIVNTDDFSIVEAKHFIIEQIWHNLPLFESAYYKDKRPEYIKLMRQRKTVMNKYGYVMREMARDIKNYGVTDAYAYNSDFDENVFTFNCDWFKCNNPFETVAIHDIWGYASEFITNTPEYQAFCEIHNLFTENNNCKTSAEAVLQYLRMDETIRERHMGLDDVIWETEILKYCVLKRKAILNTDYKVKKIIPRITGKPFEVKVNGVTIASGKYVKKYVRNDEYNFTTVGK